MRHCCLLFAEVWQAKREIFLTRFRLISGRVRDKMKLVSRLQMRCKITLAIRGIYDGAQIKPLEEIPYKEEREVIITFQM